VVGGGWWVVGGEIRGQSFTVWRITICENLRLRGGRLVTAA
jgi:hypothetical protein